VDSREPPGYSKLDGTIIIKLKPLLHPGLSSTAHGIAALAISMEAIGHLPEALIGAKITPQPKEPKDKQHISLGHEMKSSRD
jgi:hypothetical protein